MLLHREAMHAFHLGHAAESFSVWGDNLPLSRQGAYSSVKDTASLLTLEIPEYKESSTDFINELSRRVDHYRPDLMDAFMMGRGAARLVILLADSENNSEDWRALLENTKQGVAYGAKRFGIATGDVEKWICDLKKLIQNVRNNSAELALIMAHINRFEDIVGQSERAKFHFENVDGDIVIAEHGGVAMKGRDIKARNILNGTVINSAIDKILDDRGKNGEAPALLVKEISEHVAKADNATANEHWEEFTKKLVENPQKRSVLNSIWQGLVGVLPSVAKIAEAAGGIAKLWG